MSTPVPTHTPDDTAPLHPLPLVHKIFGEPRFHTDGDVAAVAFAADGTLWSIDDAGLLQHWAADGKILSRNFLSDLETLWVFSPAAQLLASGNDDLILWDVPTGQLVNRIAQSSWVTAVAFSADGKTIATGHDDGMVRFWDVGSQKFVGEVKACPKPVPLSAIAFAPRGDYLATVGEDRVVRVWDEITHKLVGELVSHTDRVPALAWSPDGALLVSAGWDTSARVWRPPQSEPLMLLNSHADQVHTIGFSPDGRYLACADSDFDIHLWTDPAKAGRGAVLRGHSDEIRCLAFSPDGSKLASAGADRVIHVWDVRDGRLLAGPNARGRHTIAVIPGHPLRLASSGGPTVRVWDTASGEEVAPTNLCPAFTVAASPDGKWLAIGGTDHFTQLWNAADGTLAASLEATKPPIGAVTFSANSKYVSHTSPADGLVWIWNCETKNPDLILIEAADGCTLEGVSFHPDGRRIAAGGIDYLSTGERDGAVCVWDIPTKDKLYTIDIGVYAVAFDPAGKYLAGAGMDDVVYVWDADTQDTIFVLGGHQQKINAIAFDPSGSYLVSGGDDLTVRVWDVLSGRLLIAREFDSPVESLAFSPDGKYLFCGNENTTCYQIEFRKLLEE
jgi:WD40 repeat protein